MARIRPKGCHHNLKIKRPKTKLQKGMKIRSCDFIELYSNISGRVSKLENIEENRFQKIPAQGQQKAGLRKVLLTPRYPLSKIVSGDLLCIPWGVRPNTWEPPFTPAGTGPILWIRTPNGDEKLIWDGISKYVGDSICLSLVDNNWCITGEVEYCFSEYNNFVCQEFPEGYSYLKSTGPFVYFEIVRIDSEEDENCQLSHYTLLVERLDQKGIIVQE